MKVGVPRELIPGERRVALSPDTVKKLSEGGLEVLIESSAGDSAYFNDQTYVEAGASIASNVEDLYGHSDIILKVRGPVADSANGLDEVGLLTDKHTLIAILLPSISLDVTQKLAENGVTSFSMDAIPRIARAQSMDALSSMASIAGYHATLVAADLLPKFFSMMITAAGTTPPAKGLVLGVGVAGLQAIATGRRLGAVMFGYDIRAAVADQVRSLGATFLEEPAVEEIGGEATGGYAKEVTADAQQRQREFLAGQIQQMDFVITTAAVPGRPAPILVTEEMIRAMTPGSVVIDASAEMGGNCELTVPGEVVDVDGVRIVGPVNLASSMPTLASRMYSRNISTLLDHFLQDGQMVLDLEDEITGGTCITHKGEILHKATLEALEKTRVASSAGDS